MTEPRRIDPEQGRMEPPVEGWLYQEDAGWYDPAALEEQTES